MFRQFQGDEIKPATTDLVAGKARGDELMFRGIMKATESIADGIKQYHEDAEKAREEFRKKNTEALTREALEKLPTYDVDTETVQWKADDLQRNESLKQWAERNKANHAKHVSAVQARARMAGMPDPQQDDWDVVLSRSLSTIAQGVESQNFVGSEADKDDVRTAVRSFQSEIAERNREQAANAWLNMYMDPLEDADAAFAPGGVMDVLMKEEGDVDQLGQVQPVKENALLGYESAATPSMSLDAAREARAKNKSYADTVTSFLTRSERALLEEAEASTKAIEAAPVNFSNAPTRKGGLSPEKYPHQLFEGPFFRKPDGTLNVENINRLRSDKPEEVAQATQDLVDAAKDERYRQLKEQGVDEETINEQMEEFTAMLAGWDGVVRKGQSRQEAVKNFNARQSERALSGSEISALTSGGVLLARFAGPYLYKGAKWAGGKILAPHRAALDAEIEKKLNEARARPVTLSSQTRSRIDAEEKRLKAAGASDAEINRATSRIVLEDSLDDTKKAELARLRKSGAKPEEIDEFLAKNGASNFSRELNLARAQVARELGHKRWADIPVGQQEEALKKVRSALQKLSGARGLTGRTLEFVLKYADVIGLASSAAFIGYEQTRNRDAEMGLKADLEWMFTEGGLDELSAFGAAADAARKEAEGVKSSLLSAAAARAAGDTSATPDQFVGEASPIKASLVNIGKGMVPVAKPAQVYTRQVHDYVRNAFPDADPDVINHVLRGLQPNYEFITDHVSGARFVVVHNREKGTSTVEQIKSFGTADDNADGSIIGKVVAGPDGKPRGYMPISYGGGAVQVMGKFAPNVPQKEQQDFVEEIENLGGAVDLLQRMEAIFNAKGSEAFGEYAAFYEAAANQMAALFRKKLGDAGVLTNQDFERLMSQMPKPSGLSGTFTLNSSHRAKFAFMRNYIENRLRARADRYGIAIQMRTSFSGTPKQAISGVSNFQSELTDAKIELSKTR